MNQLFSGSLSAVLLPYIPFCLCCFLAAPAVELAGQGRGKQPTTAPCTAVLLPPLLFIRKQKACQSLQLFATNLFFQALLPSEAQEVWPTLPVLCIDSTCQCRDCFTVVLARSDAESLNVFPGLACCFIFLSCHIA